LSHFTIQPSVRQCRNGIEIADGIGVIHACIVSRVIICASDVSCIMSIRMIDDSTMHGMMAPCG
jgi:hypothetical protein